MSIIYDALKKAEKGIEGNSQDKIEKKEVRLPSKPRLYLLYVLVICLGLFMGNAIFKSL